MARIETFAKIRIVIDMAAARSDSSSSERASAAPEGNADPRGVWIGVCHIVPIVAVALPHPW